MSDEDTRARPEQARTAFLISTLASVVFSVFGSLASISALALTIADHVPILSLLARIHWLNYATVFAIVYFLLCYVTAKLGPGSAVLRSIFRIPAWTELRSFGDQRLAKASYVVLVAIPVAAYLLNLNPLNWSFFANFQLPLNMKMAFFASWFFSMALILFTVGCPKGFRKSDPLGQAKNINLVLSEVRNPSILIAEREEFADPVLDKSSLKVRTLCFLFYGLGVIYSVIILIRSAIFVVKS